MSTHVQNHDYRRLDRTITGPARGVDLCASLAALHRVFAEGETVIHESSRDRGATWAREPAIGLPSEAASAATVPTIYCDRRNYLWVWFHNDTAAYVMRAPAAGAASAGNWRRGAEIGIEPQALDRWPRGCDSLMGPMLAAWQSTTGALNLYRPEPFGSIQALLPYWEDPIPEQLVEFDGDRRNRQHLIWQEGANTYERRVEGPHVSDGTLISGDERAFSVAAFGKAHGLYTFWQGDTLASQLTTNNFVTISAGPGEPGNPIFHPPGIAGLTRHHVGVTRDHFNWYWLLAQQDAATFLLWYSRDGGLSWQMV